MTENLNVVDHLSRKFGGQKRLAKAAGCAQQTVSDWKKDGRVPSKRMEILLRNAPEFGVELTPDEFFNVPDDTTEAA